ncbi:MAG: hypothetical protein NNA31_04660 [Nitrospira sp.]|nr:hypothetical protein [Nitrospira sp.]MCP9475935.1 hypothetical protein [Nitrospira sp.]
MAQKFGNGRWVREGFLDNRTAGTVVGQVVFAGVGPVDFFLLGDFKADIAGEVIRFRNSRFEDDETAVQVIGDMENPQIGTVNLISLDPHPNLMPHPYVEWFSLKKEHYRFELNADDAWIVRADELEAIDRESGRIRRSLAAQLPAQPASNNESEWV